LLNKDRSCQKKKPSISDGFFFFSSSRTKPGFVRKLVLYLPPRHQNATPLTHHPGSQTHHPSLTKEGVKLKYSVLYYSEEIWERLREVGPRDRKGLQMQAFFYVIFFVLSTVLFFLSRSDLVYNISMNRNIIFSPGEYYHIYSRGVDKRKIFLNKNDYNRFVKLLYLANSDKSFKFSDVFGKKGNREIGEIDKGKEIVFIGAWCLMSNHFHILIKDNSEVGSQDKGGISLFMQKLLTGYSMYFNTRYHRKGTLFESKFKAKHLDYDQYLKYQFAYIHLNPVSLVDSGWKKKEVVDIEKAKEFLNDYKNSSYLDYLGVDRPEGKIINRKEFPEYFETTTDFREMINEWMDFEDVEV
jgi:putative transposase